MRRGETHGQGGLADTGLALDRDDASAACPRCLQRFLQAGPGFFPLQQLGVLEFHAYELSGVCVGPEWAGRIDRAVRFG